MKIARGPLSRHLGEGVGDIALLLACHETDNHISKTWGEERGLLWRRIASYLDEKRSPETLASSAPVPLPVSAIRVLTVL